ncbi:unnamed protein product [Staurois parvus]|uniref:Uncharacterized protein n=1 Tax=Staurois parvus TaxID=386267 RepID=A0ABN9E2A1_9NEOB|nr:unnamed protein product [Staurois parvus]
MGKRGDLSNFERGMVVGPRGGLTTHGAPRAIGDHGPLCPHLHSKAYERYQGHLMGPPIDPGHSSSA